MIRFAVLPLLLLATPAVAADCVLGKAIYSDGGNWKLVFDPVPAEFAGGSFTNAFHLEGPNGDLKIEGTVNWTNGASRPYGEIAVGCGPDDTAEQCRDWDGTVYGVTGTKIELLPTESDPAPDQILLHDLSATMWYGSLRQIHLIEDVPWDVFQFESCQP